MTELAGTWFDGRDSRARAVVLRRVSATDLQIDAGDAQVLAPLASIAVSPRLGSTPRMLRIAGEGQVECADSPLLDDWFGAPSRIEAGAHWLERRRGPALAAAVLTVAGVLGFFKFGLPWSAEKLAPRIPARVESLMTRQVMALLDRIHLERSTLPATRQQQLRRQFAALVEGLPRSGDMRLLFRSAPGLGANAFALPDGTIVMTDELVELAASDEELIAVLAHETGHHEHRHALRQTIESSGILVVASLLFGDASGSSLTVSMPTVLLEAGFSRGHEIEADRYAFVLLRARGHSPQAFADILRRLGAKHGPDNAAIGYFSTHPATEARIHSAEAAARESR